MTNIPITLKHSKNKYELFIQPGSLAHDLKLQIQSLTNVPVSRQKLLCPKLWKGPLQENIPNEIITTKGKNIVVTLIGTAEAILEKSMDERPTFVEDLTPEELWEMKRAAMGKSINGNDDLVEDIIPLQKEIGMERDEDSNKMGMYPYSRLVTGLPQHQIHDLLVQRRRRNSNRIENKADDGNNSDSSHNNSGVITEQQLHGQVVMTLGMELRRAYVNSLAVLPNDGTLVSGLDDGHVQFWRRGHMIKDARHTGASVDQVVAFSSSSSENNGPAFVTAGDGSICIWSHDDYEHWKVLPCHPGTTPASLAVGTIIGEKNVHYLAACFRITRQVDRSQFQLVPQNEAERQRREAAERRERLIQNQLLQVSQLVKLWLYDERTGMFREEIIIAPDATEAAACAITKLATINHSKQLIVGDEWGGLRVLDLATSDEEQPVISRRETAVMQLQLNSSNCSIVCMEPLLQEGNALLAVSVQEVAQQSKQVHFSATPLLITSPRDVYLIDVEKSTIRAVLKSSHVDTIQCICSLPDGGILTAGGKMDATVHLWDHPISAKDQDYDKISDEDAITVLSESSKKLKQPGYVFDLKVLFNSNKNSGVYAVAAARYNVIQIIV